MNDIKDYIYNGFCLFCGKEADEKFYSGSYETYLECDCKDKLKYQKIYLKYQSDIARFISLVEKNKRKIRKAARVEEELEEELKRVKNED